MKLMCAKCTLFWMKLNKPQYSMRSGETSFVVKGTSLRK
jgi:hypothetical protein